MIIDELSSEKGGYSEAAEIESSQEVKTMEEPRESDLQNNDGDTTMTTRQPAQSEQYNEDEHEEEDGSGEQTTL